MKQQEIILQKKLKALEKIKELCGGTQISMAKQFNVSRQVVNYWFKVGMPINYLTQVEHMFGKKVSREEVWPDYFPKYIAIKSKKS